jgi:hypothetical protein
VGGPLGPVEGRPGSQEPVSEVLSALAVQRASTVVHQASGHGGASDVNGPVVSKSSHERQHVVCVVPNRVMQPPGLNPEGTEVGRAGVAHCLHERVGEPRAFSRGAELSGAQPELGTYARVGTAGELVVQPVAPPARPDANGKRLDAFGRRGWGWNGTRGRGKSR